MNSKVIKYTADFDEKRYWERVKRNLGRLGNTDEEAEKRQNKISEVVIGIAGCGGIGGAVAERLVRLGVRHIKVADPDYFELSNINRQFGASLDNLGRNKAEVVGESIFNISRDVNVDVYAEGINNNTADDFVEGCDYVLDKIELFELEARYALHRAFQKNERCKFMLTVPVFGHRAFFFKWTKDSMSAEDYFDIKPGSELDEKNTRKIVYSLFPEYPQFPSKERLDDWLINNKECPIFAGCPPLAQGLLVERLSFEITGLKDIPEYKELPSTPSYSMFDSASWETKIVEREENKID